MRPDSSSPVLSTRSRPRQQHSDGLGTPGWPAFSSYPLSALSLLSSPEEHRSEGEIDAAALFTQFALTCKESRKRLQYVFLISTFVHKELLDYTASYVSCQNFGVKLSLEMSKY